MYCCNMYSLEKKILRRPIFQSFALILSINIASRPSSTGLPIDGDDDYQKKI